MKEDPRAVANRARRIQVDEQRLRQLLDEARLSHGEMAEALGISWATLARRMRQLGLRSKKGRGSPMEKNYFWNGGRAVDDDGYVLLKAPSHPYATKAGYVREHRLVMEKKLGRFLLPSEVVHHRDGDRANNDVANLELYRSNGAHLREHMAEGSIPRCPTTGRLVRKNQ